MDANTQTEAILNHLKKHKEITSMEAFKRYGCTRLAARIHELRAKGYNIETLDTNGKTRYGTSCQYATYVWTRHNK